ncbi:MAG TPA: hypothetical protein ENJ05_02075 [Thiotrichales bacterium]|nr:hypothetical protein [Thiotrichales bacterium]
MKPVEYAPTAWDSTRSRDLPPLDEKRLGTLQRAVRRDPLRGRGVQCREFLANSFASDLVEQIRSMNDEEWEAFKKQDEHVEHITANWATLKNPVAVLDVISKVAIFFAVGGGVGGIIMGLLTGGFREFTLWAWQYFSLPFLLVYFLGKTAIKRGWVKDKNNVVLNRCTGMVEFTYKKERRQIPFDEFDPYISTGVGPNGVAHYYLRLIHRYSDAAVVNPHSQYETWEVEAEWERLQRFMDISKPLPDIPMYEITRLSDPTSIEHDRKTGRPPDFWRQQDPEEVSRWADASREALRNYPWGLTRDQAIAFGWQPSGFGDGEQIRQRMKGRRNKARTRPRPEREGIL